MTARSLVLERTSEGAEQPTTNPLERVGGAVQDLRDRTVGQNYALNILMLESAQETMAGVLDFAHLATRILNPMALFATPNAFFRAR